jgi:integrase
METSTEIEAKAAPTGAELRKRGKAGNSLRRPVERELSVRPTRESVRYEDLAADLLDHYLISEKKSLVRKKNGHTCVPGEPHLRRFFAGWNAEDITTGAVRRFVRRRQRERASNGTIARELSMLRRMFSLAVKARKLPETPYIEMCKLSNVRKGFLDPEQYTRLRHELPDYLKSLSSLAYFTGMRRREICLLRLEQVNLRDAEIRLDPGTTKNNEGRTIPLTGELLQILKIHLEKRAAECADCPFVFFRVCRRGGHAQWRPIGDFRKAWRGACIQTGLGRMERQENGRLKYAGLIFHDLRRSAIRNLVRAGVPERVAMRISGHKTAAIFARYDITSPRDLQEAAQKLDRYLNERPTFSVPTQAGAVGGSSVAQI